MDGTSAPLAIILDYPALLSLPAAGGDTGFAKPELYERLKAEDIGDVIRLPDECRLLGKQVCAVARRASAATPAMGGWLGRARSTYLRSFPIYKEDFPVVRPAYARIVRSASAPAVARTWRPA